MVRLPRLFGKKRGERRTGSPEWGRVTEAVLSSGLLATGLVHGAVVIAGIVRPNWRIGFGVPINEGQPSPASLWLWLLGLLLPFVLILLGLTGLVRAFRGWGRSDERRAAMGRLPDLLAPVAGAVEAEGLPSIPAFDHLTNSPGTSLAYRLPTENAEGWSLVAAGLFAASWNTMLVVLVAGGGLGVRSVTRDPLPAMILIVFAAVGIGAILLFVRRFLAVHTVGPTHVEVSRMPLEPGDRCRLRLTQTGACTIDSLTIHLEQEEQATYRQGTDVRTERRVVARLPLADWKDLHIGPANRFDGDAEVVVPVGGMHSFVSEHNGVSWRFLVEGETAPGPAVRPFGLTRVRRFARAFPVVVVPVGGSQPRAVNDKPPNAVMNPRGNESDGLVPFVGAGSADASRQTAGKAVMEFARTDRSSFDPRREVRVVVIFDRADKSYAPGEDVSIHYVVQGIGIDRIEGVERSVLWYTEGKGDEDLGVLSFDRIGFATGAHRSRRSDDDTTRTPSPTDVADAASPLATGSLTVRLPVSPLSYEGLAVKISWCVRVRVFFSRPPRVPARDGSSVRVSPPRDFVSEHVFLVGQLPPAECLSETRTA